MKTSAFVRRAACIIAALSVFGILSLWVEGGEMTRPELMLIPMAPFLILAFVAVRTGSTFVALSSSVLMVVFAVISGARIIYSLLGYDHWLLLPVLMMGGWELIITVVVLPCLFLISRHRSRST